jgi:catalase
MPLPSDPKVVALAQSLIDQLDAMFGQHPGFRPAHAKGILLSGVFTPSPEAASISKAQHFNQASTPVFVRFSNSTGLPQLPDTDPHADPRGCATRFQLAEHSHTDIVAHSANAFPSRNGGEFLEFLKAAGSPDSFEAYLASHPKAAAFVKAVQPPPSSFARDSYFPVSAFQFTNAQGASCFGRYRILPAEGVERLSADDVKAKGADYLFEEIASRVKQKPVTFDYFLQIANEGDITDDATEPWPEDRKVLKLGSAKLSQVVADNAKEQKTIIFDPIPRIDGIEPSADPLLELRAAIYLLSGRRRRAAP